MIKRILGYPIALILLALIIIKLEVNYSYSDLKEYLSILLTVSSMVFTIMGIWIAFLYPNALQRIVNPGTNEPIDFNQALNETKRLEGLVASILKSAFVVTAIMLLFLIKVIVSGLPLPDNYVIYIRGFTFSFSVMLGLLQMESIFHIIYSNILFINDLHSKREEREADADI